MRKTPLIICKDCGTRFKKTRFRIVYCSDSCKQKSTRIRDRDRRRSQYASDPGPLKAAVRQWRALNLERAREMDRKRHQTNPTRTYKSGRKYRAKVADLLAVLREEMPDLLREFDL